MNHLCLAIDNRRVADARTRQNFARRAQVIARVSALRTDVNEMPPLSPQPRPQVAVSRILEAVADYFGLASIDLISVRKTKQLSHPRHIAMFLCRCETEHSPAYIGRRFGRDHKTVEQAAHKIGFLLNRGDEQLAADIKAIRTRLGLV